MTVKFATFTLAEETAVAKIIERAAPMFKAVDVELDRLGLRMDLAAVHYHDPLDLEALADADLSNFSHDIGGIHRHLDRRTGRLTECFLPRYCRPSHVEEE